MASSQSVSLRVRINDADSFEPITFKLGVTIAEMVNEIKERFNIVEDSLLAPMPAHTQDDRRDSYSGVNPILRPSEADQSVPLFITSNEELSVMRDRADSTVESGAPTSPRFQSSYGIYLPAPKSCWCVWYHTLEVYRLRENEEIEFRKKPKHLTVKVAEKSTDVVLVQRKVTGHLGERIGTTTLKIRFPEMSQHTEVVVADFFTFQNVIDSVTNKDHPAFPLLSESVLECIEDYALVSTYTTENSSTSPSPARAADTQSTTSNDQVGVVIKEVVMDRSRKLSTCSFQELQSLSFKRIYLSLEITVDETPAEDLPHATPLSPRSALAAKDLPPPPSPILARDTPLTISAPVINAPLPPPITPRKQVPVSIKCPCNILVQDLIELLQQKRPIEKPTQMGLYLPFRGSNLEMDPRRTLSSYRLHTQKLAKLLYEPKVLHQNPADRIAQQSDAASLILVIDMPQTSQTRTLRFSPDDTVTQVTSQIAKRNTQPHLDACSLHEPDDLENQMHPLRRLRAFGLKNLDRLIFLVDQEAVSRAEAATPAAAAAAVETAPATSRHQVYGADVCMLPTLQDLGARVPEHLSLLRQCLELNGGYSVQGLLRQEGAEREMLEIIESINDHMFKPDMPINSVYSVASCIKRWFGEMPTRVFNYLTAAQLDHCASSAEAAHTVYDHLPDGVAECVTWLTRFLVPIAKNHEKSKMSCKNLAIVMAPLMYALDASKMMEGVMNTQKVTAIIERLLEQELAK